MPERKNFLRSKTIWGAIILLVSQAIKLITDTDVTAEEQQQAVEGITGIATIVMDLIGLVTVVVGRITAKSNITAGKGTATGAVGLLIVPVLLFAGCAAGVPATTAKTFADTVGGDHARMIRGELDPDDLTEEEKRTRLAFIREYQAFVDDVYQDRFGSPLFPDPAQTPDTE